ncbi:MAG: sulfatase [Bryobacteraceae bacterium]|nr:MAG: sulfatase [Bryobacteraceae bacterium]
MNERDLRFLLRRRRFLKEVACGIGMMGLADLLAADGRTADTANPLAPRKPHFPGKAKNVIFMFMEGAPSQMDLYDPKPALQKYAGQPLPDSLASQLRLAFTKKDAKILPSPRVFRPHGQSGIEFSDYIPHIASCADDLCLVRSMQTEAFNHHPGQALLFTGSIQLGRPTMGAWVLYGLGSESKNLPGFVVLSSGVGTSGGASNFSCGFMPSHYQGTLFRNSGDPILYLSNPEGVSAETQRETLDLIGDLNREHLSETGDQEIASRIANYELAWRMQSAAPELADLSSEPKHIREMYGLDDPVTRQFATNCILARRLVERGVRFVLMMDASWDQHTYLNRDLKKNCDRTDKPTAALIKDLKQRGLLESTLVVWGGEFGRTPIVEIRNTADPENAGRDHHPLAYSMWLAGGGIRGGQVIGKTDELGFNVVEDPVHVHDLQATILHCLGFDHTRLTYRHMGRDFRLTDVHGEVVQKMLA